MKKTLTSIAIILVLSVLSGLSSAAAPESSDPLPEVTEFANESSASDLEAVKGIGAIIAARIIAARPHRTAGDVRKVKGIGAKKFAAIRDHVEKSAL